MSLDTLFLNADLFTPDYFLHENVCRLCWNRNGDREISSEPTEIIKNSMNQLPEMIRECLGIDLTVKGYPNITCSTCISNVEKFYEFKMMCQENDKKLHEILKGDCKTSIELEMPSCDVKLEKSEDVHTMDFTKTDSFDSFLESLQQSDASDLEAMMPKQRNKLKKKFEPKRGPTYCNICRIDLESKEKFMLHNSESHGVEDNGEVFKCFGCEKRFKSRQARLRHEINFCKGLKDGYKCSLCERYLPKRGMYEAHMRDHKGNAPIVLPENIFECAKCSKVFKTRNNLKDHMATHDTGKNNFVCESCGRVFTRQDYLHKHKLTHSGVKRHVCPHCGFCSAQRSSLIVHIRKHTGERPYSCDVCPQRCISSSNLRAHRRRHLGLKKYECKICPKKFGYKISLEEHVASTHERSQSHPCVHCGAIYTRIRGLRRHLLAKHGKEKVESKVGKEETNFCLKIVADDKVQLNTVTYELKGGEEYALKSQDQVFVV